MPGIRAQDHSITLVFKRCFVKRCIKKLTCEIFGTQHFPVDRAAVAVHIKDIHEHTDLERLTLSIGIKRLLNHYDASKVLRIQLIGSLITSLLMPLVQDPLQLAIARSLFAIFITGLQPTLIRMVREKAPAGMDGRTLSYGTALQQVGNAVGPILGGLMAPWLGLRAYFIFCTALIGFALVLWLRREKGEGKG